MNKHPELDVEALIDEITDRLSRRIAEQKLDDPALIGIRTGGVWLAARLRERLGIETPLGELNIAFYRDDF
ncbi:MAG: bifunctional pyr operon transcriptional regulator/uracil phosphoribosyltransferase, partial [Gammaproteobacteria bacterium]